MNISRIIILPFLLLSVFATAQTDALKATTTTSKVGLSGKVYITYETGADNIEKFNKPDITGFTLISGPLQSKTENMQNVQGNMVKTVSTKLSYTLQPQKTGTFIIGPASIVTKDGTTIQSNTLTIEVTQHNEEHEEESDGHRSVSDAYNDNISRLYNTAGHFIVATGPLYHYGDQSTAISDSLAQRKIMKNVKSAISKNTTSNYLGTYYWNGNIPRQYFDIADTTGLTNTIAAIYSNDKATIYYTAFDPVDKWGPFLDEYILANKHNLYEHFDHFRQLLAENETDTTRPEEIVTTWQFKTQASRESFINAAKKDNYTCNIEDEKVAAQYHGVKTMISVRTSRKTNTDHTSLNAMARQLMKLAELYDASYLGIAVKK